MSAPSLPPNPTNPRFPDSDETLSAVQILQVWGIWPDEKRGRVISRPWEPRFPPYIKQALKKKKEGTPLSAMANYIATASAGVISELWSDARKGDTRLAQESSWVSATVSGPLLHPVIDKLDVSDDGPRSKVLYLSIPHANVERFGGIDVVCVRDPRARSVRLLEVKRLKRFTNQLVVYLDHIGTPPRSGNEIPKGTTFDVAPFCSIKTHSAELRAIHALSGRDPSIAEAMIQPQLPMMQVQDEGLLTMRTDNSKHVRTVPEKFNRKSVKSKEKNVGREVLAPSFIPESDPDIDSTPFIPLPQLHHVDDSVASIIQAVDQLDSGTVLVQAWVAHSMSLC